jgi:excisionase family DNA binding protein
LAYNAFLILTNPAKSDKPIEKSSNLFYNINYISLIIGVSNMPTKTDMPDRWRSTKEICAYLGISRDTMLVWISTKNMPAHKVGRNWKFKISEVDEWIKSGQAAE